MTDPATQPGPAARLGEDPASFMRRVHAALGRASTLPPPAPPKVDETLARLAHATDDLLAMFTERARLVGMKVHRVSRVDAAETVVAVLRELEARRVGLSTGAAGAVVGIDAAVAAAGFDVVDWRREPGLEPQYELDAGVTDVHAALAETGTLVCCSDAAHSRGLSLVPPAHVAVVRASDVLPDMLDYYARLRGLPPAELPSSIAYITGPSKTADIEGELVTGVHGPGHVHIVLAEGA